MNTTGIILLVVIVLVAVAIIAAVAMSMQKKNRRDNEARADQLRSQANQGAANTIPDAEVQAKRAEADAEEARLIAQRADERAAQARTGVVQQEAAHEDQVRAADRLDPRVDHKADDYVPTAASTPDTDDTAHATAAGSDPDTILDSDDPDRVSDDQAPGGTHRA